MNIPGAIAAPVAAGRDTGRLFYVSMAVLFVAIAALGFAPRSLAILSGTMPNPPLVVHVHAALMAAWLLLFLAQTSLIARGRRQLHRTLGAASLVVAPAMMVAMLAVSAFAYRGRMDAGLDTVAANVLLLQYPSLIVFAICFSWGFVCRRTDAETHKRMMLIASLSGLNAAFGRMPWLPGYAFGENNIVHYYQLLLFVPPVVYDFLRLGRVHRAYLIGGGLFLALIVAASSLWNSRWWLGLTQAVLH
jgi:uncharacterized membrane protein YozB (DUF420 family)